jgi:hypothetical protein
MAESKRTFQSAKMDKDIDDRILPAGTYRDALNVSVDFSEDANVGALENLKGNELLANQNILGLSAASNPNAEVIGSIAHPEENKIYYFVTGDNTDGIFEYDFSSPTPTVNTVIVDSLTEVPEVTTVFKFEDAFVTASISQSGVISVASRSGVANAITQTQAPNNTGSAISVTIQVRVRVPAGYSNYNNYVQGPVTVFQPSVTAPSPTTTFSSNVASTTATLNGKINRNNVGVTTVGFNWGYNTAGTALTASELQTVGPTGGTTVSTVSQNHGTVDFKSDVTLLPSSKLISFIAFATNSVGTEYGDVKTFNTAAVIAPTYNTLPDDKLFIFPTIAGESTNHHATYYPGYGDFEKADGNFYFAVVASKQSGLYADYADLRNEASLLSNTGPATLTFLNSSSSTPNNWAKTRSEYVTATTPGMYTITASKAGLTSNSIQIRKGSPSNAVFTSTFNLNFSKTGTGAVPAVAVFDHNLITALHYNSSPSVPLASFKIGPFEQSHGNGAIIIPIANDTSVPNSAINTSSFVGFDPTKLSVSITGKTEGVDYNYYISKEAMSIWGSNGLGYVMPAIVIEADPYTLNTNQFGFTANLDSHTLNITYNY